jgi:hypothetical protein
MHLTFKHAARIQRAHDEYDLPLREEHLPIKEPQQLVCAVGVPVVGPLVLVRHVQLFLEVGHHTQRQVCLAPINNLKHMPFELSNVIRQIVHKDASVCHPMTCIDTAQMSSAVLCSTSIPCTQTTPLCLRAGA